MATKSINYKFNQADSVSSSAYDSTKTVVGDLIKFYTGPNPEDKYVGPIKVGLARPMEQSTAIPALFISVVRFSDTIDWVFFADGAAAALTRRVGLYEFDRNTSDYTWKGFILLNYPAIGNKTLRGNEVTRDLYTTGTVSCGGTTTLTGVGTAWQADRLAVGCRIGFGSVDPTDITTWYEIATITNDTDITLTAAGPSISGVPYVIEDLRISQIVTNATVTNGGVHVVKGLRVELFSPAGTSISAATTVDNIRAVYWLKDASTQTNTIGYGIAIDDKTSWTAQDAYIINANAVASGRIFKYNLRASLSDLAAGASLLAYTLQTGQVATTGNISATGNGNIATLQHGPGSGVKSLYWVTATRIYRSAVSAIIQDSISFQSDAMIEIPPGGIATYTATNVLSSVEYSAILDRLVVLTTGVGGVRSYVTEYNTASSPFNHIFLSDNKQLDQSSADSTSPINPSINASTFIGRAADGLMHLCRYGTAAATNQIYSIPIGVHESYGLNNEQLIICPKMDVTAANKLIELSINTIRRYGGGPFTTTTEPIRVFYRTTGIDDNSGGWTQLNEAYSLEGITASQIQFAITFRIFGNIVLPARVVSINLIYEDNTTDSHYIPSVDKSSVVDKRFAYLQTSTFIGNIPELRVRVYNAATNGLVLDDNTTLQATGVFEYSTDGTTWNAWDDTENTVGNYIRYTASSLPDAIKVRVLLTQ